METQKMDIPKISNSYISPDNPVPEILEKNNKNGNNHYFLQNEKEATDENHDNYKNIFLESYINDPETFIVSTNEWLVTWRPLV
tara:strand:+ start:137 stop:388 length:252 start_codon:yes stop_codon:yes gene_type:complete